MLGDLHTSIFSSSAPALPRTRRGTFRGNYEPYQLVDHSPVNQGTLTQPGSLPCATLAELLTRFQDYSCFFQAARVASVLNHYEMQCL